MNSFPNAELDEEFGELLHYKIPQSDIKSLADSFAMLEKGKLTYPSCWDGIEFGNYASELEEFVVWKKSFGYKLS